MNEWIGVEVTLADVKREFPGFEMWRGINERYYARKAGDGYRTHRADVSGEDPTDLRDQIRGWLGRPT